MRESTSPQSFDYKAICKEYFKLLSEKDITGLDCLFSMEIILHDWETYTEGKNNVVAAYENIFKSFETIQISQLAVHESELSPENSKAIVSELEVLINQEEKLFVCDIITFDSKGMIASIRAYKG
ncbi:MAG: hypothetical protein ISR95_07395 [Candidatus Marinimicrobia bacterium]|nr:hypothetical protein [Candidatus Neomarinimicrobiota bacterium]